MHVKHLTLVYFIVYLEFESHTIAHLIFKQNTLNNFGVIFLHFDIFISGKFSQFYALPVNFLLLLFSLCRIMTNMFILFMYWTETTAYIHVQPQYQNKNTLIKKMNMTSNNVVFNGPRQLLSPNILVGKVVLIFVGLTPPMLRYNWQFQKF